MSRRRAFKMVNDPKTQEGQRDPTDKCDRVRKDECVFPHGQAAGPVISPRRVRTTARREEVVFRPCESTKPAPRRRGLDSDQEPHICIDVSEGAVEEGISVFALQSRPRITLLGDLEDGAAKIRASQQSARPTRTSFFHRSHTRRAGDPSRFDLQEPRRIPVLLHRTRYS